MIYDAANTLSVTLYFDAIRTLFFSKVIPHRRALTLRAAKGLRPFGNPE